jgi:hypothetical protein
LEDLMSSKNKMSLIDAPVVHTTSKGGGYVRPFDVLRSRVGRDIIRRYTIASDNITALRKASEEEPRLPLRNSTKIPR